MLEPESEYRLSRFLHIYPTKTGLAAESLLSGSVHEIATPSMARLLLSLVNAVRLRDLLAHLPAPQQNAVLRLLEEWHEKRLLTKIEASGRAADDQEHLEHWEFHDLLFHVRSRRGRNPWPIGATYPLRGKAEPEPVFKGGNAAGAISLARPDLAEISSEDLVLTTALERRRSLYSVLPLHLDQLSELLFRTCRVTGIETIGEGEETPKKPYPSAGSLHALEVYIVGWNCVGLSRGAYRYEPRFHQLIPVTQFGPAVEALLRDAQVATGRLTGYPPVLLIFSARFRRVSWKYQSISYRLILQEVGALYQTLYLVATAMGLAPCALGSGDSDRFAAVFGTDYYQETSVGEFILGGLDGAPAA